MSVTLTLDIGLSFLSVFPGQFAKLTTGHFFPVLPLISSSVRMLTTLTIVLSVSILYPSLLEASIQCETDALRLQWREKKSGLSHCLREKLLENPEDPRFAPLSGGKLL